MLDPHDAPTLPDPAAPNRDYVAPKLIDLGTLHELTLGGDVSGESDGFGFAGDGGELGSI
ncbi:MAG: lasso RiPP family leader peptide-containing protein [Solirubrobacteraceae bacterium]|nr:lasso RiPP family leader peptide-containing protein [Solirubrobacteraceae bacterium]